jgi:hypothetical protein
LFLPLVFVGVAGLFDIEEADMEVYPSSKSKAPLPGDDVERPVNLPLEGPADCLLTATHQRCGARSLLSSRRGPGVNTERPEPEG